MGPKHSPAGRTAAVHTMQIVTRRTGLGAELIRVWENRYGVVLDALAVTPSLGAIPSNRQSPRERRRRVLRDP